MLASDVANDVTFIVTISTLLFFYEKNFTENTVFQTRHHNFRTLQFTEMGLCLSESQISCASSDVQHFVLRLMEN